MLSAPSRLVNASLFLLVLQINAFGSPSRAIAVRRPVQVHGSLGTVNGFVNSSYPAVAQFLGIPFAEPPVGALRWEPPRFFPPDPQRTINATRYGPSCPQYLVTRETILNQNDTFFGPRPPFDEDCLNLNVWVPEHALRCENDRDLLPVLIWTYGGGWHNGGDSIPNYNPSPWIQRSGKHIVVSYNYRVSILGYPNAPGLGSKRENIGSLDQRMAVEWVRDNIREFGGDPARITLWGQSGGASSSDYYSYAWYKDPIATGFIMDSGGHHGHGLSKDTAQSNFSSVAEHFNCSRSEPAGVLECMRNIPWQSLEDYLREVAQGANDLTFAPIVDNFTIFPNYTQLSLEGKVAQGPVISGSNSREGAFFVPFNASGPNETEINIATLYAIQCDVDYSSSDRYLANVPALRYFYSGNWTNISPLPWEGAYHDSELPMIMGTYGLNAKGKPAPVLQVETSHYMQDNYLAFVSGHTASARVNGMIERGWKLYNPNGTAVHIAPPNGKVWDYIPLPELEDSCRGSEPISAFVPA